MVQITEDIENRAAKSSSRHTRFAEKRAKNNAFFSKDPKHVQNLVRDLLQMKTFVGQFLESRYVEVLQDYRDIIKVQENDPIIPSLEIIYPRLREAFPMVWTGCTVPNSLASCSGYCFWVEFVEKVYEPYTFRITDIEFHQNEVCFFLQNEGKVVTEVTSEEQNLMEYINSLKQTLQEKSLSFTTGVWQLLTFDNTKNCITFLFMLVCAVCTGGWYFLEYILKLMNELSKLIKALTPIALKCLDILQKTIGAVFIVIMTIWKDFLNYRNHVPQRHQRKPQYLKYY